MPNSTRLSSRWAGSPSGIPKWSAASWMQGTNLRATVLATSAPPIRIRDEFLADIRLAKAMLEDVAGHEVKGYRAPSFSVGPATQWAFECIAEAGYRYSSSIYPIRHDHYGAPEAHRFAHEVNQGLLEVPIATIRLWQESARGRRRIFPAAAVRVSKWSIRRINDVDRKPAMFYFHPWELDPGQPRVEGRR